MDSPQPSSSEKGDAFSTFQFKNVSILNIESSLGQPKHGTEYGPQAMMDGGLVKAITQLGYTATVSTLNQFFNASTDCAEDPPLPKLLTKNYCRIGTLSEATCKSVAKSLKSKSFALNLGGDHSVAIGTIAGILSVFKNIKIIWVDAHADINTHETSPSHNVHGMPLSFLTRDSKPYWDWLDKVPVLDIASQLVYIGLRDLDAGEKALLKKKNIRAYSMSEIDRMGIKQVIQETIEFLDPKGECPFHVSFDVDGLDPVVCPSTGTPVRGGLTFREGRYILEQVYNTQRMVSLDIVEINPKLGSQVDAHKTVSASIDLVCTALGKKLL